MVLALEGTLISTILLKMIARKKILQYAVSAVLFLGKSISTTFFKSYYSPINLKFRECLQLDEKSCNAAGYHEVFQKVCGLDQEYCEDGDQGQLIILMRPRNLLK